MPSYNSCFLATALAASQLTAADPQIPGPALQAVAPAAPAKGHLPTLEFKRFTSGIEEDDLIGQESYGLFCINKTPLKWGERWKTILTKEFLKMVNRELRTAGLPTPQKSEKVFESETKSEAADCELGFRLEKMNADLCSMGGNSKGEVSISGKWVLFNAKNQKTIAEFPGQGSYKTDGESMPWIQVLEKALGNLSQELFRSPAFKSAHQQASLEPQTDKTVAYTIANPGLKPGGTIKNSTTLKGAVVTLEVDGRTGSGFFISQDGYLITNNHVVGKSKFLRVKTATGRELPGEVLAFDERRDVALIKTAPVPYDPLSLRLTEPKPGEEVFAVGSPLGDQFNGTITKGVISGFRDLADLKFIQSDASILPGNSGGPLLDTDGAVVGIADLAGGARGGHLNLFIPIGECLTRLGIALKGPGEAKGGTAQ
ncbi:S1C family serine protease [Holophaga foetida]|uniref:S1C family serine protease n=1 Tax=Holophaga foetida TaxID=35839 RepID=UPI0002471829|nr:serine protease [Holophaga foetida]